MPEYLAPGVYVEEIDVGPVPIEGVSTSTTGFVGMTAQGPDSGSPILVTSFAEFVRTFGGYLPATTSGYHYLPYAVQGFFENGGERLYIKRVISSSAAAATSTNLKGGLITRLAQNAKANDTTLNLKTLRGIDTHTQLTLTQIKDGIPTTEGPLAISAYDENKQQVTVPALTHDYDARYTYVTSSLADPGMHVVITAKNKGEWANTPTTPTSSMLVMQILPPPSTPVAFSQVPAHSLSQGTSGNHDTVLLNSIANFYVGAIVEFNRGKTKVYRKVKSIAGKSLVLDSPFPNATDLDPDGDTPAGASGPAPTTARTCEFGLTVSYNGVVENYPTLTLDENTPYYFGKLVNDSSSLISISGKDNTGNTPFIFPSADDGLNVKMGNGANGGTLTPADFKGVDGGMPGQRTGIQALQDIEEISIIAAPGITDADVVGALIDQCELLRYRFAVLDPEYTKDSTDPTPLAAIQKYRKQFDTHYAAVYYPRVIITDPFNPAAKIAIPPSGHMAGIYARTDNERGVHKAPANEIIRGITDLDLIVNKREQEVLNPPPDNICVLRDFRPEGRGLRVWGARCITSDSQWKYINVRRLFIFVEASLDRGTQWVVFEPNDYPLWARVTQSISNFLTTVWRDGALQGKKVEEAFFVRCDRTTMTQDDIDNGRLIVLVGIAPVKPAEFVIIRISQFTANANAGG